jgi:hypothetical protein
MGPKEVTDGATFEQSVHDMFAVSEDSPVPEEETPAEKTEEAETQDDGEAETDGA